MSVFLKLKTAFLPFLLIGLTVILTGCNGIGTAEIGGAAPGTGGASSSIVFAGITSIDQKTDSTLRLNWIANGSAIAYDVFDVTSGLPVWIKTANGQASSSTILTGLTPGQLYTYLVRTKDSSWLNDNNINHVSTTMNPAPEIPSGLALITPASSPGFIQTPTIRVSGVKNGDTVKLFTDNTCATEVASGVATGSSIDLTSSALTTGSYTLYANATNSVPTASTCSTANVAYQVQVPNVPSGLALIAPDASPSFAKTPTIEVSGVTSGHTVKLFSDNTCSTEVASGTATSTTINLTTATLTPGSYTFYARAINITSSACSTANLSFVVLANFAGISSIDQTTDSTLRINWVSHAGAPAYEIYNTTSGSIYLATVSAPGTSYSITGLTPGATYRYRVRAKDSQGILDSNTNHVSVTTNLAPNAPSGLALITPASSPSGISTPTIRVSGVKNGDTVKLFTNNTCTAQVATGLATGSSIDLTSSALTPGIYTLYAHAANSVPTASACSTASLAYQKLACPTNYIPVAANTAVGTTSEFCVMKFEAKCVGTSCPTATPDVNAVATSQATSTPWISISQTNAKTACTNLGTGYDLISNPEWMTIAYNIEATASNWAGGVVGTGALFRGHSDNGPASGLTVSDTTDLYNGTGNTAAQAMGSGKEQRRTFTLSNGEVIWDLAGNIFEWTDWSL
ncbi:MAG TPA: fibronectin type III domain-containing protein, partial [Bacteriovoracaceae bacterium]|nr:fibronectin type III domain-containing protein [Bacteriovoracaceae bacterium]